MKTFEEYQFKVKHNQIHNAKKLKDLQVGDWIYVIDKFSYQYRQITKITKSSDKIRYEYDNGSYTYVGYISFNQTDNLCTPYTYHSFNEYETTDPEEAEKFHKSLCPDAELEELQAK